MTTTSNTTLDTRRKHIPSKEKQPIPHAIRTLQPRLSDITSELGKLTDIDLCVLRVLFVVGTAGLGDISLSNAVDVVEC